MGRDQGKLNSQNVSKDAAEGTVLLGCCHLWMHHCVTLQLWDTAWLSAPFLLALPPHLSLFGAGHSIGRNGGRFSEGKRASMLSHLTWWQTFMTKEPLRELHNVMAVEAHCCAQSVLIFLSLPHISAQGWLYQSCKSLCLQRTSSDKAPDLTGLSRLDSRFLPLYTEVFSDFSCHWGPLYSAEFAQFVFAVQRLSYSAKWLGSWGHGQHLLHHLPKSAQDTLKHTVGALWVSVYLMIGPKLGLTGWPFQEDHGLECIPSAKNCALNIGPCWMDGWTVVAE